MTYTDTRDSGEFTTLPSWPSHKALPKIRSKYHFKPTKEDLCCLSRPDVLHTCTAEYIKTHNGRWVVFQPSQTDFVEGTEFTCRAGVSYVEDDGSRWSWTGPVACGLILNTRPFGHEDVLTDFVKTKNLEEELQGDETATIVKRFRLHIPPIRHDEGLSATAASCAIQTQPHQEGARFPKNYMPPDTQIKVLEYDDADDNWPAEMRYDDFRTIPTIRLEGDSLARSVSFRGITTPAQWHSATSTLEDTRTGTAHRHHKNRGWKSFTFHIGWRVPQAVIDRLSGSGGETGPSQCST